MIKYYPEIEQGSDEWIGLRLGIITASEMKLLLTPKTKAIANNDGVRAHTYELAAQRISGYVEPAYISDDMLRGMEDEALAINAYSDRYSRVTHCGFVVNDNLGFKIGYSPDGLVGVDGLIEVKSRRQKFQIETISKDCVPEDHILQLQTALIVTERKWIDYVSYCAGLPMYVKRVYPDAEMQSAIIEAATVFENKVTAIVAHYRGQCDVMTPDRLTPTERNVGMDIL